MQNDKLAENSCALIGMQHESFGNFFQINAPHTEFAFQKLIQKYQIITLDENHRLEITGWSLLVPFCSPAEALNYNQTYGQHLWLKFRLSGPRTGSNGYIEADKLAGLIPAPTQAGDFIFKSKQSGYANRYAMVMQLVRSPGLYYIERESPAGLLRSCRILPALGRQIVLTERKAQGQCTLSIGGVRLGLDEALARLAGSMPDTTDENLLLYKKLQANGLLARKEELLDPEAENLDKLSMSIKSAFERQLENICMSSLGKRQMQHLIGTCINETQYGLALDELQQIAALFRERKLPLTDDRSLRNRKIKRVGDFLYHFFDGALSDMAARISDQWEALNNTKKLRQSDLRLLLSSFFVEKSVDDFFRASSLVQLLDDTNPLSEISQKRRVTMRGPGGMPDNVLALEKRDVHPSDFGRLCPIETPQGENLGFNLYLARGARISDDGLIEASYFDKNGALIFCDPYEEQSICAAPKAQPEVIDNAFYAKTATQELVLKETGELTHCFDPLSFIGYAASLIPFLQHNDANRALMGSNMLKQALPLLNLDPPLVCSGAEKEIANSYPCDGQFTKDGILCLGRNLLTGYMPWDLKNYEDGIVISDRIVRGNLLTHREIEEIFVDEKMTDDGCQEITADNAFISATMRESLDDRGIIKTGETINPGQVLASRLRPLTRNEKSKAVTEGKSLDENLATRLFIAMNLISEAQKDASVFAPAHLSGTVLEVEEQEQYLPPRVKRRVRIAIEVLRPIQVGDKLTGRHGNKGVVAAILPERDMPYFKSEHKCCTDSQCLVKETHTHLEILLNPLTITSRLNLGQLYETTLGWLAAHTAKEAGFEAPGFSRTWEWEKISQALLKANLSSRQSLCYFENGQELSIDRPVTVGYQYFLKLRQLAENKLKARGEFVYSPSTGQPTVPSTEDAWERREAQKRTAQRIGEMEVWALEGHSAWNILDELLFLKADDEGLRDQFAEYRNMFAKSRKHAVEAFSKALQNKGLDLKHEADKIVVACKQKKHDEVRALAKQFGFKDGDSTESFICFQYGPAEILPRQHRAFTTFVHYCRALGLEVEGRDDQGNSVVLAGLETVGKSRPRLTGVTIRIAQDHERLRWANKVRISSAGTGKEGLWSNDIFGDVFTREDRSHTNEATGCIQLAVPIDNPLFRPAIESLLKQEGYYLEYEKIQEAFQKLLLKLFPMRQWGDWSLFWEQTLNKRSCLQTFDDLLDYLEELVPPGAEAEFTRDKLSTELSVAFGFVRKIAFDKTLSPGYVCYLSPAQLFRHFELMDLTKLKELVAAPGTKRLIDTMLAHGYKPTDFFMQNLIVLPKNLRFEKKHFIQREIPRYKNDLNNLYGLIIEQNNRLQYFQKQGYFLPVLREEANRLRRYVYGLLVNDASPGIMEKPLYRTGRTETARSSVLSLIAGRTTGKDGLFRKNLLGKRVDFSGRGVIAVDPNLEIDEVGLPYSMGRTLFHDMLVNKVLLSLPKTELVNDEDDKSAGTYRSIPLWDRKTRARTRVADENNFQEIHEQLDELAKQYVVLLNRAPSLHRLSMLAFRPRFHDGENVIRLNPYVCAPFNADFDGDTMAVHLPMLESSRREAEQMFPSKALRSPGHGELVINYKGDLALAGYCRENQTAPQLYKKFDAWFNSGTDTVIKETKKLTLELRNALKTSGITLGIDDFQLTAGLKNIVQQDWSEFSKQDLSSDEEKVGFWNLKTDAIKIEVERALAQKKDNPLNIIIQSGAGRADIGQLSGMRGIMLRPGGTAVPSPVCASIAGGMSPLEYFVSCHGSRHGLCDKGLMTGPAGDLTNILMQAAQAEFIVEDDCGTQDGLFFSAFSDPAGGAISLDARILGRSLAENITLMDGTCISAGTLVTQEIARRIAAEKQWVRLRSPLTCRGIDRTSTTWKDFIALIGNRELLVDDTAGSCVEEQLLALLRKGVSAVQVSEGDKVITLTVPSVQGICRKCYGIDRATKVLPPDGYPAGVIAAQSIGEPAPSLLYAHFIPEARQGRKLPRGCVLPGGYFQPA